MPVQLLELVGQISDNDAKLAPVLIELQVVTCQFHVSCNILTHVEQAAAASVRPSSCPPPFTTVDTEDCDTFSPPPPHPPSRQPLPHIAPQFPDRAHAKIVVEEVVQYLKGLAAAP